MCKEPRNASEESRKKQSQTAASITEPAINSTHPICFADNFSINLTIHTPYFHDMTVRNQIYPSQVPKFVIRCGKKKGKKKFVQHLPTNSLISNKHNNQVSIHRMVLKSLQLQLPNHRSHV